MSSESGKDGDGTLQDKWVFGSRDSGAFLPKFAWTRIVRHQLVKGGASPDDPTPTKRWRERRRCKAPPPMGKASLVLAVRQQGLCPFCKQALIAGAEYEPDSSHERIDWFAASKKMLHKHHFTYRRDGGTDEWNNLRLVHSECHRQHHAGDGKRTTPTCEALGACLSRMPGNRASPVLRGRVTAT
ncbi:MULTISPECIES: HNH endonuclease [unclassified Kitasatospora]|uniref:HNH endonuclease n=1 Tax=unclassified Kitasatospora TaxID=2633591 RepID=UPI00380A2587